MGYTLLLLYLMRKDSQSLGTLGISLIGLAVYSQPCQLLCIVCELTTSRIIQVVLCLSLGFYCLGRVWIIALLSIIREAFDDDQVDLQVALMLLAPAGGVCLLMGLLINDSPRYFIESNIHKAEELIKRIIRTNTGKETEITNHIDENFMLKRINLRRYNYLTLTKYPSFGFSQCTPANIGQTAPWW